MIEFCFSSCIATKLLVLDETNLTSFCAIIVDDRFRDRI